MVSTDSDSKAIQYFEIHDFAFKDGTHLPAARLAYLDINPQADKVALIPTCFRGRLRSTLTFAESTLKDYRIIVVALFGNGESSSPSNTRSFPSSIDYRDCVRAQYALLTGALNVHSLDVIIGFSMGGQCAYYWTAMHPQFVGSAVIICSSARTSAHNYQFLEGPKAALEYSIDYAVENRRSEDDSTLRGLRAFGKAYSAWLTSADWFDQGLYKDLGFNTLQEWDENVTNINYRGWDPDDLLVMLRMWQNGNITVCAAESQKSLEEALASIEARVLLLPCETDQYFRPNANMRECEHLTTGIVQVIPSVWGHLAGAGLCPHDTEWMAARISQFLEASS